VLKYGNDNWSSIAEEFIKLTKNIHRNGKQCRERWHNHLDPIVNKDYWTKEEENILFLKQFTYGNKWSEISKFLPGRYDIVLNELIELTIPSKTTFIQNSESLSGK